MQKNNINDDNERIKNTSAFLNEGENQNLRNKKLEDFFGHKELNEIFKKIKHRIKEVSKNDKYLMWK